MEKYIILEENIQIFLRNNKTLANKVFPDEHKFHKLPMTFKIILTFSKSGHLKYL